jgi:hypothetical protein
MKEQLINFDNAKLAKEKGYINGDYRSYIQYHNNYNYDDDPNHPESYKKDDIILDNSFFQINNFEKNDMSNEYYTLYEAPTQSLLQKWLREIHKIEISIETIWADEFRTTPNYIPWVYYTLEEEDEKLEDESPIYFKTYEEALEIGLQEALNTIK